MDHLVVQIVFLLACVCIDVCVKFMWTIAGVATIPVHVHLDFNSVWMYGYVCAHTECLLSGVEVKVRLLSVIIAPALSPTPNPSQSETLEPVICF